MAAAVGDGRRHHRIKLLDKDTVLLLLRPLLPQDLQGKVAEPKLVWPTLDLWQETMVATIRRELERPKMSFACSLASTRRQCKTTGDDSSDQRLRSEAALLTGVSGKTTANWRLLAETSFPTGQDFWEVWRPYCCPVDQKKQLCIIAFECGTVQVLVVEHVCFFVRPCCYPRTLR